MKFATAINCIDGKIQTSVIEWIRKEYKVDYVDMILSQIQKRYWRKKCKVLPDSIKKRVEI